MSIYQLRTFGDLIDAVMEQAKIQSSDIVSRNRIKRDINLVYLNEVVPYHPWKWLNGYVELEQDARYSTGTASVTASSTTVILTTPPSISLNGFQFVNNSYDEVYTIEQHTAGSSTLTLSVPYTGVTESAAAFQIWSYKLPLPVDCRQTTEVFHAYSKNPIDNVGKADFLKYQNVNPQQEGRPAYYTTSDYIDASSYEAVSGLPSVSTRSSSGVIKTIVFSSDVSSFLEEGNRIRIYDAGHYSYNGEFVVRSVSSSTITYVGSVPLVESATVDSSLTLNLQSISSLNEKYRELWIWPASYSSKTLLRVSYIKDPSPLEDDNDEPLIPISDRAVLLYGALVQTWSRERNPEEAARNANLYERKLFKMVGKFDDSGDAPLLRPSPVYLSGKRNNDRVRSSKFNNDFFSGGGGSAPVIKGTANTVTIFNSTGDIDSSSTVSTTELNKLDGILSAAVGISDTQTLTNKTIDASSNSLSNIANANISASAAIAGTKVSPDFGSQDVTTTGTITGSNLSGTNTGDQTISLTSDVSGSGTGSITTTVNSVGGSTASAINTATVASNNATNLNTVSTIVKRDGSGNFSAGTISAALSGNATTATKPASGATANQVAILDGSGNFTSEAQLAKSRGGTGADNSSVTFPSSGTIVTRTASETLTNKTLTSPVISSIVNTGTLTLPTSTDTLVGRATTDTLTNKTLTTPTINQPTINGVTTATAAPAGAVGEVLTSTVSALTNVGSNGAYWDATSISVTPGRWRLEGTVFFNSSGVTWTTVDLRVGISTTTGNSSTGLTNGVTQSQLNAVAPTAFNSASVMTPVVFVSVSSTTTYYLKATADNFTAGTPQYQCSFSAQRIY